MFPIRLGKNGDDVNGDVVLRQSRKVCDGLADVVACLVESANLRDRADLGAFGDPPPCAPAFGCDSEPAAHRPPLSQLIGELVEELASSQVVNFYVTPSAREVVPTVTAV